MDETTLKNHINHVDELFTRACTVLKVKDVSWRVMIGRTAPVNTAKNYSLGYTNLLKREITVDIFTPRRRQPKSANGLLRLFAHELAHLQKPPYKQRYKGRWITRIHFPDFYNQVNKNIKKFKKDKFLIQHFRER